MKIALVIGRFQIVGNQHVDLFKQIEDYENKFDKLSVVIATTGKKDSENPFEPEECLEMVKPIAENTVGKLIIPLQMKIILDINDPIRYNTYIADEMSFNLDEDEIIVFSENQWTISCFEKRKAYQVVVVKENLKIHSTMLRQLWEQGKNLSKFLPETTIEFFDKIKR